MNTLTIIYKFIKHIFPLVKSELERWKAAASLCPDDVLAAHALSSINKKAFHAIGGSVFALFPGADIHSMVKLIVAYQTMSDYLDNLCDRAGVEDEKAFFALHLSMEDALSENHINDYYINYPFTNDNGYLKHLVGECKKQVSALPSFSAARESAVELAKLYSSLQVYKHLHPDIREEKLFRWSEQHLKKHEGLMPWEFWAASGSTLGIFMIFAAASNPHVTEEEMLRFKDAYFPWVCGLHILLDYLIDYSEDMENGDLNFVAYYKDENETLERFNLFIKKAIEKVSELQNPIFHSTVILGLLAMYLSDPKAYYSNVKPIADEIISWGGMKLKLMHRLCLKLRERGSI